MLEESYLGHDKEGQSIRVGNRPGLMSPMIQGRAGHQLDPNGNKICERLSWAILGHKPKQIFLSFFLSTPIPICFTCTCI